MSITITNPTPEVDRDRYGRPLISPPGGGKPVSYTRATTIAGTLDDMHGLMGWKQRMTAIGVTDRPDLQIAVAAHRDDKKRLDSIVEDAMNAAAASAAATTGTALHALTEQVDRGQPLSKIPDAYRADLDAYTEATKDLTAIHIEQMSVLDEHRIAGTPDRIVELDGELYVADVKSGTIAFPHKIAIQLGIYAHAVRYDVATGERTPWDATRTVNTDRALIIHLPAGQGRCELVWVDIAAGWEAVDLAMAVRGWRKRRDLTTAYTTARTPPASDDALAEQVASAPTVDALLTLWGAHQAAWTDELTSLAQARKALLTHP